MKRFAKLLTAALLSAVVSANVIAFMQARAMTNFTGGGERSAGPEQLSLLDGLAVIVSGVNIPRPQNRRTPADLGHSFETHRFPSGNGSTLDAWYMPGKDEGVIVALFHGYAASKSTLLPAAGVFHEIGVGTLLVDFYGSGESSGNDTTLGVEEARNVEATINFARRTWPNRKIVLYGASMGGAAILRAIAAEGAKPDAVSSSRRSTRFCIPPGTVFTRPAYRARRSLSFCYFGAVCSGGLTSFRTIPSCTRML
jgi:uncharacterized protein